MEIISSLKGINIEYKNIKGVCLFRQKKYKESARLFMEFIVHPDSIIMRDDVPDLYKINYATALLLSENYSGFLSIMHEIDDKKSHSYNRIMNIYKKWKNNFSFWEKIKWIFDIQPKQGIIFDFVPGEIEE